MLGVVAGISRCGTDLKVKRSVRSVLMTQAGVTGNDTGD